MKTARRDERRALDDDDEIQPARKEIISVRHPKEKARTPWMISLGSRGDKAASLTRRKTGSSEPKR
jgi:hypothetical protein